MLFGFDDDTDPDDPTILASPKFIAHAENLISMLDSALNMLGPDQETLTEILQSLGKRVCRMVGSVHRLEATC